MNRRLLILDEVNKQENYSGILGQVDTGLAVQGATALKINPAEDHYELIFTSSAAEALAAIEKAVQEKRPFVGGFFNLEVPGGGDASILKRAKELDPKILCVILTSDPDKGWKEIHSLFGEEYFDHWDLSVKTLTSSQILQKAQRMCASWERRKRERGYEEKISHHEEQMMRAERLAAIGTLSRGLGAEFGNTLHTIMGKADVALQKRTPEAMEGALKHIVEACEKVSTVVRNLQSLVKSETVRENVNLEGPIEEAIALIEFEMKKSKIKLVKEFDGTMPTLRLNRFEINQVFLNIMINSIHAMEKTGGTLTVKTVKDLNGISISFGDTGCGIPAENMPKIFEPLFTTKVGTGSGIGLSVTKKIMENHGGKVKVASAVGKGTTFTLWFPK